MEQHSQLEEQQSQLELLIAQGSEQGYLTLSEVHDHLPEDLVDADQIKMERMMVNALKSPDRFRVVYSQISKELK